MSDYGERIAKLEKGHEVDHAWISGIEERVHELEAVMNKAKGGWVILTIICGGSAGIGGLIVKFF